MFSHGRLLKGIQADETTKINTYFYQEGGHQRAVFRIERNRDYTVMSNHHLWDTELSLKPKGLLSMMLSLPEEWNYTTRGLAAICKEGADCIGSALRELEQAGYIVRSRIRDSHSRHRRSRSIQIRKTRIWIPRVRK